MGQFHQHVHTLLRTQIPKLQKDTDDLTEFLLLRIGEIDPWTACSNTFMARKLSNACDNVC